MATIYTGMRSVLLLILAATRGHCEQFCHRDADVIAAVKTITQVLQCFGESTQDSLRLQMQNSDALTNLQSTTLRMETNLTREIADQKEQLKNKDEMVNVLNQEIVGLKSEIAEYRAKENVVDKFVQELRDLKESVKNQNNTDGMLSDITDLKNQLQYKESKVQYLNNELLESQRKVKRLEKIVKQLNETEETPDIPACNSSEYKQKKLEINNLVKAFNEDRKWSDLRKGLESVLDHDSEALDQALEIWYDNDMPLWTIGTSGCTELAALLLCAGLPAGAADGYADSALHGASHGGHLQLAELLVRLGADVNARELGGWTPLMRAAFAGQLAVVEWLVQAGAVTSARDDAGRTALRLASVNHQAAVKEFLQHLPN